MPDSARLLHVLVDQFGYFEHADLLLAVEDGLVFFVCRDERRAESDGEDYGKSELVHGANFQHQPSRVNE